MAHPNFLIIGDLKAGTSSLHHYLDQHPAVFMPRIKELRYFAFDENNPYHLTARSSRVSRFDEYLRYFEDCGQAQAIGEASPNYLRCVTARDKIAAWLPGVKLIVSLRNPADRLYSAYLMGFRSGSVRKSFSEIAFGGNAAWVKGNAMWPDLKRYFERFDKSQLHVILFDDLVTNTQDIMASIYRFLGIDDSFVADFAVQNPGGVPRNQWFYSRMVMVKRSLKMTGLVPGFAKRLWRSVKDRSLVRQSLDPQIRSKILEICSDDILRTQDLIQRDLSAWLKS